MKPETIPGFDCLEFKWKVQSEIYDKTKDMTVAEQIEFFRRATETGPFADLVRAAAARGDAGPPGPRAAAPSERN